MKRWFVLKENMIYKNKVFCAKKQSTEHIVHVIDVHDCDV